jgi:surface protein
MKKLNTSNFNTSNVTDMNGMFSYCNKLTSLDVSNFNTSKVTDMERMFGGCNSLTILDVSKWDTSNVTDMRCMFGGCNSLTILDVSKWDTSNVTDMRYMFQNCNKLTTLDVSNFNTSKVANMGFMFKNCNSLTSLNLNNFKVNAYKDISGIIAGCTSLTPSTLKMDNFKNIKFCETNGLCCGFKSQAMVDYIFSIIDTSNSSSFKGMFERLDIKDFVVPNINFDAKEINTLGMFAGSKMENLDLSKWDTSNVVNMEGMFYNCDSLTTLNISNWDTSNVTDMGKWGLLRNDYLGENAGMFENCTNLTTITGIIDMSSCVEYDNMFRNCNKLTGVKLKNVPKNFNASTAGLKEGQYTIVS